MRGFEEEVMTASVLIVADWDRLPAVPP